MTDKPIKRTTKNRNLHKAKKAKNDEFYTQLPDIEKELKHYKDHFKNKTIFLNCDDPEESNFWKYFVLNFNHFGLKKLISTHYDPEKPTYKLELTKEGAIGNCNLNEVKPIKTPLEQNGDFRSPEAIEILKECDIVVTNPPFSLFREYIAQLIEYEKKFIIMGNMNAITYKETFKLIKNNQIWPGYEFNKTMKFRLPNDYEKWEYINDDGNKIGKVPAICWYTNFDIKKRHEELILYKKYNKNDYPKYDNYNVINVRKVVEIPMNYKEAMGVPVSFLNKFNPKQFEILSSNDLRTNKNIPFKEHGLIKDKDGTINGVATYVRIVIKNRKL